MLTNPRASEMDTIAYLPTEPRQLKPLETFILPKSLCESNPCSHDKTTMVGELGGAQFWLNSCETV